MEEYKMMLNPMSLYRSDILYKYYIDNYLEEH